MGQRHANPDIRNPLSVAGSRHEDGCRAASPGGRFTQRRLGSLLRSLRDGAAAADGRRRMRRLLAPRRADHAAAVRCLRRPARGGSGRRRCRPLPALLDRTRSAAPGGTTARGRVVRRRAARDHPGVQVPGPPVAGGAAGRADARGRPRGARRGRPGRPGAAASAAPLGAGLQPVAGSGCAAGSAARGHPASNQAHAPASHPGRRAATGERAGSVRADRAGLAPRSRDGSRQGHRRGRRRDDNRGDAGGLRAAGAREVSGLTAARVADRPPQQWPRPPRVRDARRPPAARRAAAPGAGSCP